MASGDGSRLSDNNIEQALFSGSESECSDFSDEDDFVEPLSNIISSDSENSSSESENEDAEMEVVEEVRPDGWQNYTVNDQPFRKFNFTVNSGFKIPVNSRPINELGYFQLYFTDSLFEEIVASTNAYAKEKIQKNTPLQRFSIWNGWTDTNVSEIKAFLGVVLNMALNPKPDIFEYFSEDWLKRMPFFKNVFSRQRFLQLFWSFHVTPVSSSQGAMQRHNKVKYISEYIDSKCRDLFTPKQEVAIDESTVGFKGRLHWKCYNPNKPTKWGLRIYCLCDSATGYVYCHIPYYGKRTTDSLIHPELPFTSRIVLHLVHKLIQATGGSSGFHIFTDRFYTGPGLAMELRKLKMHTTGTVQLNRKGLAPQLKNAKIRVHETVAYQKENEIMHLSFRDKRVVSVLSTYYGPHTQEIEQTVKGGNRISFQKPVVIINYTKNMGGVDRADQYCGTYAFQRKSYKWWRKLLFWLVEVSIVNSYILYKIDLTEKGEKIPVHKVYRERIIRQLIGDTRNKNFKKRGRPSSSDTEDRLNGKPHFIMPNDKKSTKDCAVCSNRAVKGGRKETIYFCETCERKPGLHPGVCFKKYHTQKKFR